MKTVSVVMCTYNGAKYLREQLDSIISQTYPIYELIVQDDCSTDETVAIIKEYMEKYSFIKLYVNEHNLGFNLNFKSVCMKATGDFVALSDQDDVWFPDKIQKQVNMIGTSDICCTSYTRGSSFENAKLLTKSYNFERLLFENNVSGHTMLCQRAFIQDERHWLNFIWYDWSLALHASLGNGITKIEAPLNWHREHKEEVSTHFMSSFPGKQPSKWKPYVFGFKGYRKLQKNKTMTKLYSYLYGQTSDNHFPLIHKLCELLMKEDFISLFRLCRLCQINRTVFFDKNRTTGFMGWVRGFFFPFIIGYFCIPKVVFADFTPPQKSNTSKSHYVKMMNYTKEELEG